MKPFCFVSKLVDRYIFTKFHHMIKVFKLFQRTTPTKPKPRPTCGGCWTWQPARPDSPSPNGPPLTRTRSPRRTAVGLIPGAPGHLRHPMGEVHVRLQRDLNRPFRRSRRASGWQPFIRRRSSPTSTSSSLSLTSPLPSSVSPLISTHFLSSLFGSRENVEKYSPFVFFTNLMFCRFEEIGR